MTSLPYPSFLRVDPVSPKREGLTAVGRCRIHPKSAEYEAIVALNVQQALTDDPSAKQERKKYMKQGIAACEKYLQRTLRLDTSIVDVEVVLPVADIVKTDGCLAACFLDAGCAYCVMEAGPNMEAAKIPAERMIGHVPLAQLKERVEDCKDWCRQFSTDLTENWTEEHMKSIFQSFPNTPLTILLDETGLADDTLIEVVGNVCAHSAAHHTVALTDPTATQLGQSMASCVRTDRPDGLFTTVVVARTGEALGLVYSSPESIVAALECGRGVYYSRSRQGLWRKGDTSGHYQTLHRFDVDCDGDALKCTVTQNTADATKQPAFCHLETYTCWGQSRSLHQLQTILQDRLAKAPEGSYTKRLFDDPTLLRNKLVEEAQELAEAETPKEVAGELADLLYFALVKATQAGVDWEAAVATLDQRHRKVTRRQGDAKAFRIAAGEEILKK